MRIAIIVEGATETAFKAALTVSLRKCLSQEQLPSIKMLPQGGRVPTGDKLKKLVDNLCRTYDAVIALTDVYTGTPDFKDAADAKQKMRNWVGVNTKFYPHAAQHDFEAWLIPFWDTIQKLSGTNRNAPTGMPETVNHSKPPAHRIKEIFEIGSSRESYVKPRDGARILRDNDLLVSANVCPELKSFLNTILTLSGGTPLP